VQYAGANNGVATQQESILRIAIACTPSSRDVGIARHVGMM
jgi:hypothetical protein